MTKTQPQQRNEHLINHFGNFYFAMTQGAAHWTRNRAEAFKFATREAAEAYGRRRLKTICGIGVEKA